MGADLYIEAITKPAKAKYEPLFDEAVERRNKLSEQRDTYQRLAENLKVGVSLPSIRRQASAAQTKVESLTEQTEAAQAEVSKYYNAMYPSTGYFRDSYNGTSVLWCLGLSWWKDIEGGNQTPAMLRKSLKKIKSAKLNIPSAAELKKSGCAVDNGKNSLEVWTKYYRAKHRRLVTYFERAIKYADKGTKVYFSL